MLLSPDAPHLASILLLLMQISGAQYRTVVEVRQAFEPVTSRLAASRMTDESVNRLKISIDKMRDRLEDESSFLGEQGLPRRDRLVIGEPDAEVLQRVPARHHGRNCDRHRLPAAASGGDPEAHEDILEAMRRRDPDEAEGRMRAHIEAYVVYAEKKFPKMLDRLIQWDAVQAGHTVTAAARQACAARGTPSRRRDASAEDRTGSVIFC